MQKEPGRLLLGKAPDDSSSSKYDLVIRQEARLLASHLYFSFRFYQIVNNDHHQRVSESHCCTKTNHCHLYHAQ